MRELLSISETEGEKFLQRKIFGPSGTPVPTNYTFGASRAPPPTELCKNSRGITTRASLVKKLLLEEML